MIICKSRHVAASDSIFYWRLSNIPVCVCMYVYVCAKWLRLCLTVCSPMDCRPPGPLSMGFSRREHWSGLPCSPPGDLHDPGIKPTSPAAPALQVDSLPLSHWGSPVHVCVWMCICIYTPHLHYPFIY